MSYQEGSAYWHKEQAEKQLAIAEDILTKDKGFNQHHSDRASAHAAIADAHARIFAAMLPTL